MQGWVRSKVSMVLGLDLWIRDRVLIKVRITMAINNLKMSLWKLTKLETQVAKGHMLPKKDPKIKETNN